MKGAIASVEIYAHRTEEGAGSDEGDAGELRSAQRLTFVVSTPERRDDGVTWACRVALADLHRAEWVEGPDSVAVLSAALARGRVWLEQLERTGLAFYRDREGRSPYSFHDRSD